MLNTIYNLIDNAKAYVEKLKRDHRFRKMRLAREEAIALQVELDVCRGKLALCQQAFNRAINEQSRNIKKGMAMGTDTLLQERILKKAAVGYLLVRDAIYALETISNYDSVAHAYDLLDEAMKHITQNSTKLPESVKLVNTKERNEYGYITSYAARKKKEQLVASVFEKLKIYGDIEARLKEIPADGAPNVNSNDTPNSEVDDLHRKLNGNSGAKAEKEEVVVDDSVFSYNPSTDD